MVLSTKHIRIFLTWFGRNKGNEQILDQKAAESGFSEVIIRYRNVCVIAPLKQPVNGMKVRVDGRTFVKYHQFESGDF